MRVLILLVAGCMVVITTSLPAGPVEDQAIEAIEPQAKPESRLIQSFYRKKKKERHRPCYWKSKKYCESCGDETDQEKKQDCKIRELECAVTNNQRCIRTRT